MRITRRVLFTAVVVGALTGHTRAHHSLSSFDQSKVVTLRGTVTAIEWLNPHAAIILTVKNPDGTTSTTRIDTASPTGLQRRGIEKSFVNVGDTVTIDVWVPQIPRAGASASGRTLTLSDGRRLDISDNWSTMTLRLAK